MEWKYEKGRVYSMGKGNELMAEATFSIKENGEIDINHTYVNPVLRGRGVAGEMMTVVCKFLRKNKLRASATCPYASTWLEKHKDLWEDVISEGFQ